MQYILTEEEYKKLVNEPQLVRKELDQTIQYLCQMVADHKILTKDDMDKWSKSWWIKDRPWGCIRSSENERYCDQCPVGEICTYPHKNYSK